MPPITIAPALRVDGQDLSDAAQEWLIEVRVERQFQVPSRATLRFMDPGYEILEKHLFSLGSAVTITDPSGIGLIDAEVTSFGAEHRPGTNPVLLVVAHDKSHRLGRSTNVKTYLESTYSEIAEQLASDAGLIPSTDTSTVVLDYVMQVDSDLGLLTEMARRIGFDWWVAGSTLYFKKPATGATVELALYEDLHSLSVRASGQRPDSVVLNGWDRSAQNSVTSTTGSDSPPSDPNPTADSDLARLVSSPSSAFGAGSLQSSVLSAQNQQEIEQLSRAVYNRALSCAVTAEGIAYGNGHLQPGTTASISGGGPLNGSYPVTKVEHIYRPHSGFQTRFFSGDRWPTSLVDTLSGASAARRPATSHPGLAVGIVTNIKDDEQLGRVKLKFPGLSEEAESNWARVVAIGGGKNRGTAFIPEVNDEVLVAFEGGDPRQPVVIGGLYSSTRAVPSPNINDGDGTVQSRGMTSRLGHFIGMLDGTSPEQQAIELSLAADAAAGVQSKIHFGKDKTTITVPANVPVEIHAGESSLSFDNEGKLSITAPQVSINAEQQFSVNSGQISLVGEETVSLEGGSSASIEGGEVSITSDGPLSATGEPISLN